MTRPSYRLFIVGMLCALSAGAQPVSVTATGATQPLASSSSAVGSSAVWLHPTDVGQSLILGVNGKDGLLAYDLDGGAVPPTVAGLFTAVDVRYGFPLAGKEISLVVAGASDGSLSFFTVNPSTRQLESVTVAQPLNLNAPVSCVSLWHVTGTADYQLFAMGGSVLRRFALFDDGTGRLGTAELGPAGSTAGGVSGCAVDEATQSLYYTLTHQGLFRLRYLADGGSTASELAAVGSTDPNIGSSLNGLTLLKVSGGGYLMVASPGASGGGNTVFSVYDRLSNAPIGAFEVLGLGGSSAVQLSAGLTGTSFGVGPGYPQGLLVVHDGRNGGVTANFKLVPFGNVAAALGLATDPSLDPRGEGPLLLSDGGVVTGDGGTGSAPSSGTRPPSTATGLPAQSTGCGCQAGPSALLFGLLPLMGILRRRGRPGRSSATS